MTNDNTMSWLPGAAFTLSFFIAGLIYMHTTPIERGLANIEGKTYIMNRYENRTVYRPQTNSFIGISLVDNDNDGWIDEKVIVGPGLRVYPAVKFRKEYRAKVDR